MEFFQVKKTDFRQGIDNLISFGNLDYLKRTNSNTQRFYSCANQLLHRRFHPGNYVFSKLFDDDSNLSIIIHHENVDAKVILQKLREESMEMAATNATETKKSDGAEGDNHDDVCTELDFDSDSEIAVGHKSLIGSNDWCKKENGGGEKDSEIDNEDEDDDGQCEDNDLDHPPLVNIDYYVTQKIYDARIQQGDSLDEAKSKSLKYLDLLFVVNNLKWMKKTDWNLAPMDNGKTYKLEFQDGAKIGYAFDMKQYFGEEKVRGILLQHLDDEHSTVDTSFALILESEEANLVRPEFFVYPMDEFFYGSVHRRFVETARPQDNPYYGDHNDRSPFATLPPNLFVKIVSYLSLKERVLIRRVNDRWREISNTILAVGTKRIDQMHDDMVMGWTNDDLNRVIPLVAGGLESMTLDTTDGVDFEFVMRPDVYFRSLLEVDIGWYNTLNYDLVTRFMEKAPCLKKFTGNIRLVLDDRRKFKSIEELNLGRHEDNGNNISDSYLMTMVKLFPNIRRLSLHRLSFISASAASVMAEQLGTTLEHLEMRFASSMDLDLWIPPLGVFDGIGLCANLRTLIVVNSHYVSNGFIDAIAAGCPLLETLVLAGSPLHNDSPTVLKKLSALAHLTKLNVNYIDGVSDGLMSVIREGRLHLEQILLRSSSPSVELIKACVRYCTGLILLDVRDGDDCSSEDAIEILTLYGRYGRMRRMVIRTDNPAWLAAQVGELQLAIKNGDHPHTGLFVIDQRFSSIGFVENAAEEYETADPNVLVLENDEVMSMYFGGYGGSDDDDGDSDDDFDYPPL